MKTIKVKGKKFLKGGKKYKCKLYNIGVGNKGKRLDCASLSGLGRLLERNITEIEVEGKTYLCDLVEMHHGGKRLYCTRLDRARKTKAVLPEKHKKKIPKPKITPEDKKTILDSAFLTVDILPLAKKMSYNDFLKTLGQDAPVSYLDDFLKDYARRGMDSISLPYSIRIMKNNNFNSVKEFWEIAQTITDKEYQKAKKEHLGKKPSLKQKQEGIPKIPQPPKPRHRTEDFAEQIDNLILFAKSSKNIEALKKLYGKIKSKRRTFLDKTEHAPIMWRNKVISKFNEARDFVKAEMEDAIKGQQLKKAVSDTELKEFKDAFKTEWPSNYAAEDGPAPHIFDRLNDEQRREAVSEFYDYMQKHPPPQVKTKAAKQRRERAFSYLCNSLRAIGYTCGYANWEKVAKDYLGKKKIKAKSKKELEDITIKTVPSSEDIELIRKEETKAFKKAQKDKKLPKGIQWMADKAKWDEVLSSVVFEGKLPWNMIRKIESPLQNAAFPSGSGQKPELSVEYHERCFIIERPYGNVMYCRKNEKQQKASLRIYPIHVSKTKSLENNAIFKAFLSTAKKEDPETFSKTFVGMINKFWKQNRKKWNKFTKLYKDQYKKDPTSKDLWYLAHPKKKKASVVYKKDNVSFIALGPEIVDKLTTEDYEIFKRIGDFLRKTYPKQKIKFKIGAQAISGPGRVGIPTDMPVKRWFPYDPKIKPEYAKIAKKHGNKITATCHDVFHELAHQIEGYTHSQEVEADWFALKLTKKMLQ